MLADVLAPLGHYNDVIMGTIASQITSLTIVYSTVYSDADQGKHQSSASLAFVRGIHRGPVNSQHKWPVTRKMFLFNDVIMCWGICRHSVDQVQILCMYTRLALQGMPLRYQGWGLLCQSPLLRYFPIFSSIVHTHVSDWISHLYLTGVPAVQFRWHLSNMNLIKIIKQVFL